MYTVHYNGRTSYVSSYFYCCVQLEGLLYDAECNRSAIPVFLVITVRIVGCYSNTMHVQGLF